MTISLNSNERAVIKLFIEDLRHYHLDFSSMSLADSATKKLLCDLFDTLEKMGMPVRSSRMTVECAESCDAPVTLLVTAQPKERYVFLSGADVASALAAFLGRHVADGTASLSFDSGRWTVELHRPLSGHDAALLAEFCVPPVDISADLL